MPKKIDLIGDDDDKTKDANRALADEIKAEGKVVNVADDDDEGTQPEPQGETSEEREARLEKRRQRGRDLARSNREAREAQARAETEARILRESLAEGARATREMTDLLKKQQPKELDDLEKQEQDLLKEREDLVSEWNGVFAAHQGAVPRDIVEKYDKRNLDLTRRLAKLDGALGARAAMPRADPATQQAQQTMLQISVRHPDVHANPRALAFAQNYYRALVAEGKPSLETAEGMLTVDSAMDEARKRFHIGGKPKVSDAFKQRFISSPRGGAPGGGDEDTEVVVDKETEKLAMAFFAHDKKATDEEKLRKFVRMHREK